MSERFNCTICGKNMSAEEARDHSGMGHLAFTKASAVSAEAAHSEQINEKIDHAQPTETIENCTVNTAYSELVTALQDNQEAAEQAADECAKEKWVHEPTTEKAVRYGFLAGAKWQKAEDVAIRRAETNGTTQILHERLREIDALKQQVAELEKQVIDAGYRNRLIRNDLDTATQNLIEAETQKREAQEALAMSSARNGLLSDRIKQLESEEPSLRAANECNRKCLAQLAKAEKREREAVAALESIAMMARVKPTYNDYQLRIDMEDLANAALAAFPSPCE